MSHPDACTRFVAEHELVAATDDPRTWTGHARGVPVRVEVIPDGPASRKVRVAFPLDRRGLVMVSSAHVLSTDGRALTGDPEFDGAIHLRVDDPIDLGCFTEATRALARELIARGGHAAHGALRLEPWADVDDDALPAVLERMVELARALAIPTNEAVRRFAIITATDPDAAVRAAFSARAGGSLPLASAIAGALARESGTADDATFARLAGQLDDDVVGLKAKHATLVKLLSLFPADRCAPIVRQIAAGRSTRPLALRALVRRLEESAADPAPWLTLLAACVEGPPIAADIAEAIARACADANHAAALPCLIALASDDDPRTATAALRALVRLPISPDDLYDALPHWARRRIASQAPDDLFDDPARAVALVARCHRDHHGAGLPPGVREATLRVLAEHGDASVQDLLVAGLEVDDEEVRALTIAGLGRVGDADALAALRPLASGFFRSTYIKAAARDASEIIQERLAGRGSLSLAEDGAAGGALALSDDEER
ncbi:MAG: HEAT repeat domain-containing protein [Deltaproteobacteria bacterium]|nr:HEAT repeat domain-containing protein [Deltaproteobacteria bacterium]